MKLTDYLAQSVARSPFSTEMASSYLDRSS